MARDAITQCHECGLLQRIPVLPVGAVARCPRCGCRLHSQRPDSLEPALALTLAGVVLFAVANSLPFLSFQMQGQTTETTLATGVVDLYAAGRWELAAVVGFTSILAPGLQLALLLAVLVPLKLGRLPAGVARLFRYSRTLAPWGMMDVFMLGILVAVVKLSDMATLVPGTSLFAFVVLIFVLAAAQAALDPDIVWSEVPLPEGHAAPRTLARRSMAAAPASWWCRRGRRLVRSTRPAHAAGSRCTCASPGASSGPGPWWLRRSCCTSPRTFTP